MRSRDEARTSMPSSEASSSRWYSVPRRASARSGEPKPESSPMNVAARKTRLTKIASPSCTNMPRKAGPDGSSASAPAASTKTPAVARAPTGRRPRLQDPRQQRHRRGVHRDQRDARREPEQHEDADEEHERDPLGSTRVLEVMEVRRWRAPEDLLGHTQDVDRGEEGAGHRRQQPPGEVRAPRAHEGQDLGHEA